MPADAEQQSHQPSPSRLGELLAPLREQPRRSAILCDIDGTLAPITPTPEQTSVPEAAREALRELAAGYALVACITGRQALEARRMVGVDELHYVGNHGFERLEPGAGEPRAAEAIAGAEGRAADFLAGVDMGELEAAGMRPEDKGAIQSLHWRGAGDEPGAERLAHSVAERAEAAGLEARWGRKVLELRPRAELDKGTSAEELVAACGCSRALFGGDDITDLDGFAALRRLRDAGRLEHAVCVGVASDEQPRGLAAGSDVLVDGPEGFLELLAALR